MSKGQGFWFVEKGDTLWGIAKQITTFSSNTQIANKVNELIKLNPHIKNPDRILAGSVISIGNDSGFQSQPIYSGDLIELEKTLQSISPKNKDFIFNNWEYLEFIKEELDPKGSSFLDKVSYTPSMLAASCGAGMECISGAEKFVKIISPVSDISEAGFKTFYQGAVKSSFGRFRVPSPQAFQTLEGELLSGIKKQLSYIKLKNGAYRMIPNNGRAFPINGKLIVIEPSSGNGLRAFSQTTKAIKATAETLEKFGGRITFGIDLGVGLYEVNKDWDTPERNKTVAREGGKLAAKTAWTSTIGVPISTGVCGLLTFSTGVGGVVCFLVVYGGSTYAMGELGGKLADGSLFKYHHNQIHIYP